MEAMVVEQFDTFESHLPSLLNGDGGTGCSRVTFQQGFSLYTPAFLRVQGRYNLRDHGFRFPFTIRESSPHSCLLILWR